MTTEVLIHGRDVRVGDVLTTCGPDFTVARFVTYPNPWGHGRIAVATDGREMTVFNDHPVWVRGHH